ncbi:MAG: IS3 family transposase [Acidimicrobiales bacterium]
MTRFIDMWRDTAGVEFTCGTIGCPVSTYYERKTREPSLRDLQDAVLVEKIREARSGYARVYGVRKTWRRLQRMGIDVGRDRVARLMRREGLVGCQRGKGKRTTIADETAVERARDLVQRRFEASGRNMLWVADLTYIRTYQGWAYLAFIKDAYSRMIVGWQLATHMRAELVLDALEMANALRQPKPGLVAHSDRGSQGRGGPCVHLRLQHDRSTDQPDRQLRQRGLVDG